MRFILLIALILSGCEFKPSAEKYEKPSNEQIACLKEYVDLEKQEMKDEHNAFFEAIKSKDDDHLIRYELAHRRNEERLCMIKSDCYDTSNGIEFSDCLNDVIPNQ